MFLSGTYIAEFQQLLKIVLWVSIPLILISMLVATILHYRKKNREDDIEITGQEPGTEPAPENAPAQVPLQSRINYNLRSDIKEGKYVLTAFNTGGTLPAETHHAKHLRNVIENQNKEIYLLQQQKQSQEEELGKMDHQLKELTEKARLALQETRQTEINYQQQLEEKDKLLFDEKKKLTDQLAELNNSFKKLEEENLYLQEQLLALHGKGEKEKQNKSKELQAIADRKEKELQELKNKLTDQAYLQDMINEKKLQVDFLQSQLEQRIRQYHELEQTQQELTTQLNEIKDDFTALQQEQLLLKTELQLKNEETVSLSNAVKDKQQENERLLAAIQAKHEHVNYIESKMNELAEQYQSQKAIKEERENAITQLQQAAEEKQQQIRLLKNKLQDSQLLLLKIYDELTPAIEKETGIAPAIMEESPEKEWV
jgi:DNA repair exonuclease SbcCD ATPase subunit